MDNYIPYDLIQKQVNLPDNAKIVILANSGHMGFVEEEELTIRTIREFVCEYV
jgi:pimeloyl-ACP methyl ester carboxylesterase